LRTSGDSEVRIAGGSLTTGTGSGSGSTVGGTPPAINNSGRSPGIAPATGNRSRETAYRQSIANPYAPATTPLSPNASPAARSTPNRPEAKLESNRRSVEAPANRTPIARSTEVVTPRYSAPAPSAPISRPSAPSAPAPSRSESYRSSSPAPAPRESAPAKSSEGNSRSSRSSDDGNGRRGR
jgi:hypothetical protein